MSKDTPKLLHRPKEATEALATGDTELLTADEAATRLKLGRTKIYELMERGELRSIKIDRCRRIPSSEIPAFIARKLREAQGA